MKKHLKALFKISGAHFLCAAIGLMWLCASVTLTGCKKDSRLFTHVDSTAEVPSQFHFFNTFAYDSTLTFAVDGLPREAVKQFSLSKYYPSSSAFNPNEGQANSKLINISDAVVKTKFANAPDNSTFQFKPNTSYIVFSTFAAYDTVYTPVNTIVPKLIYYPEDVYHPFDGTTGIRLFNCIAGSSDIRLSVSPNIGQGTSVSLMPIYFYTTAQPARASDTYNVTQKGLKNFSLQISSYSAPQVQLSFKPFQLDDGKNYSFFAVGDITNFIKGKQPRPKVYAMHDGDPSSLKELTVSSLSYPGNASTAALVKVINDAYNVPGFIGFLSGNASGLDVRFNQSVINVLRWPISPTGGEDIHLANTLANGGSPTSMLQRISYTSYFQPGQYSINVTPGRVYSPNYHQFNYDFQVGSYTVCLLPDNTTSQSLGHLVLENDLAPDANLFKLRIINILGGSTQVDVHIGSPTGPILANAVTYGQANDYIALKPNLLTQNLYVTAAGSTVPLFQTGSNDKPIAMPFTAGNSGTLYIMGLLPGTPYKGDSGSFGPYVYYSSDAYVNPNFILQSAQLYYIL